MHPINQICDLLQILEFKLVIKQKNHLLKKFVFLFVLIFLVSGTSAWMVQAQTGDGLDEKGIGLATRFEEQERIRVIVQLNVPDQGKAAELMTPAIHKAQSDVISGVKNGFIKVIHEYDYIPFMALEVDRAVFEALQRNPLVVGIEEDILMKPLLAQSVPLINADDVWAAGYTGNGQVVAVLDTGVDKNHPALAGKVVSEACYSSTNSTYGSTSLCPGGVPESTAINSALPYINNCPAGECDHGTHVAGIVAANGTSLKGVAIGSNLIAIQVFSRFDSLSECSPYSTCVLSYTSDQIKGLDRVYGLRNTYQISAVNLSLGGGRYYDTCDTSGNNISYKAAVDNLRSVGIVTIAASGNNGFIDSIASPACISSVVSVGATTDSGTETVANFSNSVSFLDLLAPGEWITSSIPSTATATWRGTSMAAPHVAGAWALLRSYDPSATVDEILNALKITGVKIQDSRNGLTKPRINVYAAAPLLRPFKPTNIDATEGSHQDKVALSWIESDYSTYYQVFRSPINSAETATQLTPDSSINSFDDTTAEPGTIFNYWVKACSASGCSDFSIPGTGWRGYTVIPPPSGVSASDEEFNDKVRITWYGVGGASHYQVFRNTTNSPSEAVQLNPDPLVSPYDDTTSIVDTPYYYWVKACDDSTCSDYSSYDIGSKSSTTINAPTSVSASDGVYKDRVRITWNTVADATQYKVFRNTSNTTNGAYEFPDVITELSFDDLTATPGTVYYYWVQACNISGCSDYSANDSGYVQSLPTSWKIYLPLLNKNYADVDPIKNGNFELGRDGSWTESSSKGWDLIVNSDFPPGISPRSGSWLTWLGGADNETSILSQSVLVSSSRPYLHYWYWIASSDFCDYDMFKLKVNSSVISQSDLCSLTNTGGWVERVVNLSGNAGSTVTLMFEVTTDESINSNFFLDDVSMSNVSTSSTAVVDEIQEFGDVARSKKE
jgi:subtilisin family serine protease